MMTRKDYVETSRILSESRQSLIDLGSQGESIFENLVADFAVMFEDDNPRFDAVRFDNACWGE
jgi:hypothetical protein